MQLKQIARDALLKPLQAVSGIVERRHTLPILANVLIEPKDGLLELTATDLEMQISAQAECEAKSGAATTVSARKLHDLLRALPDDATLNVEVTGSRMTVRAGRSRADAMRAMADRLDLPAVGSWVSALVAAERHGSGLGPILRAQAEQRRQERFQRAEKLAMKAPVKMLFPLLVFIFPCTFVLLGFPVVVRLIEEGLLR